MTHPILKFHPQEFSSFCTLVNNALGILAELISQNSHEISYHRNFANLQELARKNAIQLTKLAYTYRKTVNIKLGHDTAFTLLECILPSQNNPYLETLSNQIKASIHRHYYASIEGDLVGYARLLYQNKIKLIGQ